MVVECRLQYEMPDGTVKSFTAQGANEAEAYACCMHEIKEDMRSVGRQLDLTHIQRPPGPQYSTS
jgi:hypothetical protein